MLDQIPYIFQLLMNFKSLCVEVKIYPDVISNPLELLLLNLHLISREHDLLVLIFEVLLDDQRVEPS